ncbi:MAG TPA: type II toxin-antitoxin system VapC family toxin, partial [Luteolibacter sp.]|nr:type II toxin-antitoxin system VapC family toxin [Luteolibacter sp.]
LLPDVNHKAARRLFESIRTPVLVSPLNRLEFETAVRRMAGAGSIQMEVADNVLQVFDENLACGYLRLAEPDGGRVWARAMGLARHHAATLSPRSLDIWHLALALEMGAKVFWTFDDRQKRLAQAAGLRVNP